MIILTAVLEAAPGKEEELETELRAMIPPTAREEGVLEYRLLKAREDAGRFCFVEKYSGQAALDNHMAAPHVQALFARFDALLAAPPAAATYELVDAIPE